MTDMRSSTPLTPCGISRKSSLPKAFWSALCVLLSDPVSWRSLLSTNIMTPVTLLSHLNNQAINNTTRLPYFNLFPPIRNVGEVRVYSFFFLLLYEPFCLSVRYVATSQFLVPVQQLEDCTVIQWPFLAEISILKPLKIWWKSTAFQTKKERLFWSVQLCWISKQLSSFLMWFSIVLVIFYSLCFTLDPLI